jgi:hypothetical protein
MARPAASGNGSGWARSSLIQELPAIGERLGELPLRAGLTIDL